MRAWNFLLDYANHLISLLFEIVLCEGNAILTCTGTGSLAQPALNKAQGSGWRRLHYCREGKVEREVKVFPLPQHKVNTTPINLLRSRSPQRLLPAALGWRLGSVSWIWIQAPAPTSLPILGTPFPAPRMPLMLPPQTPVLTGNRKRNLPFAAFLWK